MQTWLLTKASARLDGCSPCVSVARACVCRTPVGLLGCIARAADRIVSEPASPQMNVLLIITGAFCGSIFLFGTYAHESVLKAVPVEVCDAALTAGRRGCMPSRRGLHLRSAAQAFLASAVACRWVRAHALRRRTCKASAAPTWHGHSSSIACP